MAYQVKMQDDYDIVLLTGDVDLSCSPEARKAILASLEQRHHTLVDLSAVTYIDSSGVASLVEGFQTAKKNGLRFGLIGVSEAAMSVLELARLDKVFPIHADLPARLEADG
ncbi:MAG: STAS domain-containing protein [Gammaproteobacteria bacterium]